MKQLFKHLLRFKYLILSVFLFIFGYTIDENYIKLREGDIDPDKFLKVLRAKENSVDKIIKQLGEKCDSTSFFEHLDESKILFNHKYLKDNGFCILIYKNDSLAFWTDNSFELKPTFSESELNRKLCLLSNGWYISNYVKKNNITIVGLFLVQNHYNFANKFLKQDFQKDFGMSSNIRVSMATSYYGVDIYDKDNNYLLSLIPSNKVLTEKPNMNILAIIYLIAIILLLKFLQQVMLSRNWDLLIVFGLLICLRIAMMVYTLPKSMYNLSYFSAQNFAESFWFPSLGDIFLNSLLIIFIIRNLYITETIQLSDKIHQFNKSLKSLLKIIYFLASFFTIYAFFVGIDHLIKSLILNSNIPFQAYKILDLSQYSLVGFMVIALLFGAMYLLLERLVDAGRKFLGAKYIYMVWLVCIGLFVCLHLFKSLLSFQSLLFIVLFISIYLLLNFSFEDRKITRYMILISITSLYCSMLISDTVQIKENGKKKALVSKLVTERDQIGEYLLGKMEMKLKKDTTLEKYVTQSNVGFLEKKNNIINYLKEKYFNAYWSKYLLEIDICGPRHEYQKGKNYGKCADYYIETEKSANKKLRDYDYYYVENKDGSYSYIGFREYKIEKDSTSITLFIKLNSKLAEEDLGYPELLLESKDDNQNPLNNYSYAKYTGNNLISKHGSFYYSLNRKIFDNSDQQYSTMVLGGYEHLIYKDDKENTIILSSPIASSTDIIVVFAYLFLFFNIMLFLVRMFDLKTYRIKKISFDFNTKLFIATNSVMFFSFLLVGGGTVFYNVNQYKENHQKTMNERIQSALKKLEQEYSFNPEIFKGDRRQLEEVMNRQLVNLSQVLFVDLNLYDLDGKLIASSRPEIYDRGFVGKRINSVAFEQLVRNKQAMYVQEENVGKLEYSSAYVPFRSADNQTLAYLHLPYFTKPELLKRNISTLVVAIGNLYAILFILSLILAAFISNSITQPLVMLRRKFTEIELGKKNEPIHYESQDEIGSLVKEYNRMVAELKKNIELMARNEREAAWKEMARSVAHEIKNPLMPMRLNMQQLQRLWKNEDQRFGSKFIDMSDSFIGQIDILTHIATSFSSYAKMPTPNNGVFDIVKEVKNAAYLFQNNDEGIDLQYISENEIDEIPVFADKEQFTRVVVNLLKNSIQAFPTNKVGGFIKVKIEINDQIVIVSIEDNGSGISEEAQSKIFTPSFTTKSSGMGLGLAMSREIITAAKGNITFETKIGEGTTFFIELPIHAE